MALSDPKLDKVQKLIKEMHVLIVDDEQFDRDLMRMTLEKIGVYSIECAENGAAAIERIKRLRASNVDYDAIFLDWKMPVRDGHSLLQVIRRQLVMLHSGVFITTSSSSPEAVKTFLRYGADDFIVKPIALDVVQAKLERFALKLLNRGAA